jgi:uncharacterized protein YndB with AHSA1/START domain
MPPIVSTIDIARPPDEVFRYVTDPSRFAEWQRDVVRVQADPGPLPVGATFTTYRRMGGTERATIQQVTEASAPRTWAARGIDGPIRPHAVVTIEPLDGGTRSRVTFALDFEGHGVGVALLPVVRRLTRRGSPVSYGNLKRLLEARAEPG